jgi:hypothetical protein
VRTASDQSSAIENWCSKTCDGYQQQQQLPHNFAAFFTLCDLFRKERKLVLLGCSECYPRCYTPFPTFFSPCELLKNRRFSEKPEKPAGFLTQKQAGFSENRPVFRKTGRLSNMIFHFFALASLAPVDLLALALRLRSGSMRREL